MKTNFKLNLSKATDPQKTIFEVRRIRWDKYNRWIKATGIVHCGGDRWEHTQVFYIPSLIRLTCKTREEILKNLPLRID